MSPKPSQHPSWSLPCPQLPRHLKPISPATTFSKTIGCSVEAGRDRVDLGLGPGPGEHSTRPRALLAWRPTHPPGRWSCRDRASSAYRPRGTGSTSRVHARAMSRRDGCSGVAPVADSRPRVGGTPGLVEGRNRSGGRGLATAHRRRRQHGVRDGRRRRSALTARPSMTRVG
jgi:hypothetical protein